MTNDRQKALDELQKELLEDDLLQDLPPVLFDNSPEQDLDLDWEELLSQLESETAPAFDDPVLVHSPAEPVAYRNFSNNYGRNGDTPDLPQEEPVLPEEAAPSKKKKSADTGKEDKWQTVLMAVACFLCLGIIGVLIYWLEVFLK